MSELSTQIREVRAQVSKAINAELTDADILRFLRARNLDLQATLKMIVDWHAWRHAPICETSTLTPATVLSRENFKDAKEPLYASLMPHSNIARDKAGRPIYFEKTGLISNRMDDILKKFTTDELVIRHVRQQELMMKRIEDASRITGTTIEKQVIVFDLKSLSFSLNTAALGIFQRCISIDQSYYPERLQHFFFLNTPFFFQAIWAIIRPFIDKNTVDKFKILGSDYLTTLTEFIDINQIPSDFGGSATNFSWQWPSNCDIKAPVIPYDGSSDTDYENAVESSQSPSFLKRLRKATISSCVSPLSFLHSRSEGSSSAAGDEQEDDEEEEGEDEEDE